MDLLAKLQTFIIVGGLLSFAIGQDGPGNASRHGEAQEVSAIDQGDTTGVTNLDSPLVAVAQPAPTAAPTHLHIVLMPLVRSGDDMIPGISDVATEFFRLRLAALGQLRVEEPATDAGNAGRTEAIRASREIGATHMLEVACKAQGVSGLVVVTHTEDLRRSSQLSDCTIVTTRESLGQALDSCLSQVLTQLEILPSDAARRFFQTPILGDAKVIAELAGLIGRSSKTDLSQRAKTLDALGTRGPSTLASYLAARAYAAQGNYEKAAATLTGVIDKIGPFHTGLYALAARYYRLGGVHQETYRLVKIAEQMRVSSRDLLVEKSMALEELDDRKGALEAYRQVLDFDPLNQRANKFLMEDFYSNGAYEEAIGQAKPYVAAFPHDVPAHILLAKCFIATQKNDEAVPVLQRVLEEMPANLAANILMGDIEMAREDWGRSLNYYWAAISDSTSSAEARVKAAQCLQRLGGYEDAFSVVSPLEDAFYENAAVQREIGLSAYATGKTEIARRCLSRSVSNGDADTMSLVRLAHIHCDAGDTKLALEYYERVKEYRPDDPELDRVIAALDEKPRRGEGGKRKDKRGKLSMRVGFSVGTGAAAVAAFAAGVYFDRRVTSDLAKYNRARNQSDVNSYRDAIERNISYRNILYGAGSACGVGCGLTILISSRKHP